MKAMIFNEAFDARFWELREEFLTLGADGELWNQTLDSSSSATLLQDGNGGVELLTTVDNDNAQISSTNEIASITAGSAFEFMCEVDATVDADGNIAFFVGLVDDDATDLIVDGGANVKTTLDGFGFFVADDALVFQTVSSNGTTQDIDSDVGVFATGTTFILRISGTTDTGGAVIRMYINGGLVKTYTEPLANQDPMHLIVAVKGGSANDQILNIQRLYFKQWRA